MYTFVSFFDFMHINSPATFDEVDRKLNRMGCEYVYLRKREKTSRFENLRATIFFCVCFMEEIFIWWSNFVQNKSFQCRVGNIQILCKNTCRKEKEIVSENCVIMESASIWQYRKKKNEWIEVEVEEEKEDDEHLHVVKSFLCWVSANFIPFE